MNKKDFYEKYVKDNRTEDEKIMDIIHNNARKSLDNRNYQINHKQTGKGHLLLSGAVLFTDLIIIGLLITLLVMVCIKF